ncbi:jouberin-like isoform X2 [Dreissena polymorpha]|uniref:jouberin-like isoform X2 n=1 Tax=Dreissena polymorpha TaxID=45954 RepID=UPI0022651735|nr:jouberin-like isoform X2 [Dreissena polymorpha]
MADEAVTEKPKKTKRTPKKAMEDIPMSTFDKSGSKFEMLLQQAVDQSLSEARKEKKKKKNKGDTSVLESLRKGEGLQKDVDETQLANMYDPDDTKFEKSNKRKQKILDDKNRQNELNIVDETKGKTKKKKKGKGQDELIENVEESHVQDKTMTMAELDASVATGKKKKKKKEAQEEAQPVTSARSEEEPSSVTSPKKKPRKKPTPREDGARTPDGALTPERVLTPTKKKKAKSPDTSTVQIEDETATPTKSKKKKAKGGATEDEGVLSPEEEPVKSPKGKKGKKKKTEGETEDESALSPSEEPMSPKGKKGKKKKGAEGETEEAGSSGEGTQVVKKGAKVKKGQALTDEEGLSPSEEAPGGEKKTKKKKKKTVKDEETEEKDEEETEAPKPKERKKKTKKADEEATATEDEEVPPDGMDAEDDGRILAVTVHRTDKLKNDFYIMHPMVRVHVFDELTGHYLPKQHKDRAVTAYYETKNDKVTHILPIMTKPFDFKLNKSVLPVWEELLVFNENYNYFIQDKPKVMLLFELVDFVSMNRTNQQSNDRVDKGLHRIAWAFLKIVGNNKKINTGSKVRLQLFEPPEGSVRRRGETEEEHFLWWKNCPRKPYPSTLYLTLKGITPPSQVEPAERSLFATQEERGRMTYEDLKKTVNWTGRKQVPKKNLTSWSRLAGQLCRIPNQLSHSLPTAKKGCYIVRFSHDGRSLACACQGTEGFPILVYEMPSGRLRGKFSGHFGIVYDMSWSKTDKQLLTASSDGTARIWNVEEFGEQQQKLLPHPSFVYCSQFHPRVDNIAVTGCFDQVIRVWDVEEEGDTFRLRQELDDHPGLVNSICFSEDGQKMYSADSTGVIIIWNSFFTEQPTKKGVARDWTKFKTIEDPDIKGTVINFITLHPRERRLLVHCRDNVIRMFDLRIERVMQKYIGALNFREQIRSTVSPCGSFVFSGSEDNFAYAWNTDTGDQVIMYSELNFQNPVTDVHYHPRDHMVAFCSLGENHPVLVYSYDVGVAQYEAGLSPRVISPSPAEEATLGTPKLAEELASKGVLSKEEFDIHTAQRFDKVMKTLNKVTMMHMQHHMTMAQMTMTPTLDLPGTAVMSPRSTMMTLGSHGYDMYGTTPRSMTGSPTMFSPHASRSMEATKRHQHFAAQNMYMKGADSWRPKFSEVGRHGRSTSPVFGRGPQMNLTGSAQGKAQFNFEAAPGKSGQLKEKYVVIYDYKAQRSDELDLFAGDEVTILHKDTEHWWMGELANGDQGYFPANYVIPEGEELQEVGRRQMTPDDSDTDTKQLTAVRTKSGELKFVSGNEESEDDLLESSRSRRRKKRNSQDSAASGASLSGTTGTTKKPPRKAAQKVRINEDENTESKA